MSLRTWRWVPVLAVSLLAAPVAGQVAPGTPPMDPRPMSGVPRVDPETPPGALVVRVLRGSFQDPGVGLTVTLELEGPDGKRETRTVVSAEQGRASFAALEAFAGWTAVASVDFGGEVVKSQPLRLDPNAGVRMLLVKGAGAPAAAAAPAEDVPRPGAPFPNPGQPKGTVVVGALDLARNRAFTGIEVRLEVVTPGAAAPELRKVVTDGRGAARFQGLEGLPAGTKFTAEADLDGEVKRSETFTIDDKPHGVAVVLTTAGAARMAAPERRQVLSPRAVTTVPAGTVKATVIGPDDRPVPNAEVTVIKQDFAGTQQRFVGAAGTDGVARVADIAVADDSLYQVEVRHHGAPFRSRLFQMTDRMGVLVEVRVFPVTDDVSRIRSAVQFGVEPTENDMARVVQLHQVVVEGDAAYWPSEPLRLSAPPESNGMVVLEQRATVDLQHKEQAPYATLMEPLPPGEVSDLSIAYLVEHDGVARFTWTTPFPVTTGRAVVTPGLKVVRGAKSGPVRPPHEGAGPAQEFDVYDLGELPRGGSFTLEVEGLVTSPRIYRRIGAVAAALIALGTLLAVLLRPRASLAARLRRRQAALLRTLGRAEGEARTRVILELDQVLRQLDVLSGTGPKGHVDPGAAWDRT
jgi:hypothetical protein